MEARRWIWPAIWTAVIVGECLMAWDAWSQTPAGQAKIAQWRAKVDAQREKAKNCGGCARRREALRRSINWVHWNAEQIVEGNDVETVPEP